tara:strand:- start:68270 stop:68806 length:537 start_codon:yes stop_codon:yes gene_type:complete
MKKLTTLLFLFVIGYLLTSCDNKLTLQSYLIESKEKKGFMNVDIPFNLIQLKNQDITEDIIKTYESIKKVNISALPYVNNEISYEIEKKILLEILNNSDNYKDLFRMDAKGMKMNIYCNGESDLIKEVIVFGYSKQVGVGVARILGDNMNPNKIMQMIEYLEIDPKQFNLKQFNLSFN